MRPLRLLIAAMFVAALPLVPSAARDERWNGTGWRIETTPNPPGATLNSLNGVDREGTSASRSTARTTAGWTSTLVEVRRG
jgi:hypothetical protein